MWNFKSLKFGVQLLILESVKFIDHVCECLSCGHKCPWVPCLGRGWFGILSKSLQIYCLYNMQARLVAPSNLSDLLRGQVTQWRIVLLIMQSRIPWNLDWWNEVVGTSSRVCHVGHISRHRGKKKKKNGLICI